MFSDPQSVTLDGSAVSLPRTGAGLSSGAFTSADRSVTMEISHDRRKRNRTVAKLTYAGILPDPLVSGVAREQKFTAHVVIDRPLGAHFDDEATEAVKALVSWLSAGSYAAVTKLIGGES